MEQKEQILWLAPRQIHPNPRQPRQFFEEKGLQELADSIRCHGILQPLTVRRRVDGWELVAGERRLRAARMVGLEEVPCLERQSQGAATQATPSLVFLACEERAEAGQGWCCDPALPLMSAHLSFPGLSQGGHQLHRREHL